MLTATLEDATEEMLAVAAGRVSIVQLTEWLRSRVAGA
jgi:hypothetical protein